MPFIGRYIPPKPVRQGCPTPRWTYFILKDTLWQCPSCKTVYRLEKREDIYENVTRRWVKQES